MEQLGFLNNSLLPREVELNLKDWNPWWNGKPAPRLPKFKRWLFKKLLSLLQTGITQAVVLRGPRRVGKTILLRQVIETLLNNQVAPNRILYIPYDEIASLEKIKDPVLNTARWFERSILGQTFNEAARNDQIAYLFLDEVQNLEAWAPQIKSLVDNHEVRILVTGSSSLRIEAGRDSLAGRIKSLDLGPMLLREIADLAYDYHEPPYWFDNGSSALVDPNFWIEAAKFSEKDRGIRLKTFKLFSERGAYPVSHEKIQSDWQELSSYLNETIIKRAIQHDLRIGPRGAKRDEKLLEEVFRLACRYAGQSAGQSVFVPEIKQALDANIGWNRILTYLKFLDGALLIRLVEPMELRLKRRKSPSKICLCDHALRASWLQEIVPLDEEGLERDPHLSVMAGHIAESALGYFLSTIPNLETTYFPSKGIEPEVDFVITVGTKRIPIEVKYRRRIDPFEDTRGLRAFLEKTVYNANFGLLVTLKDDVQAADSRIIPISLSSLLWLR